MSLSGLAIATASGACKVRAAVPVDEGFLYRLFCAEKGADLKLAGLAEAQIAGLLEMQHRGQAMTYASAFPDARSWIVDRDGEPVARLLEADTAGGLHIVDIAVAPDGRRQGIARGLLLAVQDAARAAKGGVGAHIYRGNDASRALFRSLGFEEAIDPDDPYLRVLWNSR